MLQGPPHLELEAAQLPLSRRDLWVQLALGLAFALCFLLGFPWFGVLGVLPLMVLHLLLLYERRLPRRAIEADEHGVRFIYRRFGWALRWPEINEIHLGPDRIHLLTGNQRRTLTTPRFGEDQLQQMADFLRPEAASRKISTRKLKRLQQPTEEE